MEENIIELAKAVELFTICTNCHGGHFNENGICQKCGLEDKHVVNFINKLKIALENVHTEKINDIDNSIYVIREHPFAQEYLNKKNYTNLLKEKEEELHNKINSKINLSNDDFRALFFLANDFESNYKEEFLEYLILFHNKDIFTEEEFEKTLESYVSNITSGYTNNSILSIQDTVDENSTGVIGLCKFLGDKNENYSIISLRRKEFDDLYNKRNYNALDTIFHETTHTKQFSKAINGENDDETMLIIKDLILSKYIDGYYDENYEMISYENDAIYKSCLNFYYLILKYDIKGFENLDKLMENISKLKFLASSKKRTVNGNSYENIDDIFNDFALNNPTLLDESMKNFPQLKEFYEDQDSSDFKM